MNRQQKLNRPKNPHSEASRLSKMTFWWLRDVFKVGISSKDITEEDIFATLDDHETEKIVSKFSGHWKEELERKDPSIVRMFFKMYGPSVLTIGLAFSVLETLNRCFQPLFLGALLTYFTGENEGSGKSDAYLYGSGIVVCSLIPVLTFHPFIFFMFETGMKLRIGCSGLIYEKILRMSKSSQVDGLHGRVINLLSNDLSKFELALCFLHDLWKGPFETFLLGYLVYNEIGVSGIVGIVFILSFVPIQAFIGKKSADYRNRTAKRTDIRVRLMNEIINGIQIIKMYTWESNFAEIIAKSRKKEIAALKGSSYIMATLYSMWAVSRFSIFLTLITYVSTGNVLTARKVFIVSAFFNILNDSMVHFWPLAITFCAEGAVSCKRLKEFLLLSENKPQVASSVVDPIKADIDEKDIKLLKKPERIVERDSMKKGALVFEKVNADWVSKEGEATTGLDSINLDVQPGELYVVVGTVGSGKTSLLHSILGELEIDSGRMEVHGSLSYANQESFIFKESIQKNILFTEEYDEERYRQVVSACALEKDFEILEYGDQSVVGEKGISLSGGQKARINLARAVYKKADIYLLDDPLSAVDSHVGKHIFNNCILTFLKGKTVVLVTHQLQYLKDLENIILMESGRIESKGSYAELDKTSFAMLMNDSSHHVASSEEVAPAVDPLKEENDEDGPAEDKESQEVGTVSFNVYKKYVKSIKSTFLVVVVIILRVAVQAIASSIDFFIAQWVNWEESIANNPTNSSITSDNVTITAADADDQERSNFIMVYIILMSVFVVVILKAEFSFFYALLRASKNLHDAMFRGVIKTYMLFFNQNPSGRILNRFSKDIGSIDRDLPNTMFECVVFVLEIFAVMVLVSLVNVYFIIPTIFMAFLLYGFRYVYVNTSRKIKRVESVLRSPIYSFTNATLLGLSTIKAFNAEDAVKRNFASHIDYNAAAWFMFMTTTRAFALWLDICCVIYIAVITYTFVEMDTSEVPGGNVGLAITQIIGLIGMTQFGIRQTSELENQMISVERILEYTELPSEEDGGSAVKVVKTKEWPHDGDVEFEKVSLFYNDQDKPAINDVSFKIKPKEKIGVVGRTGSGKSSLIQALFRLARVEGSIKINGTDAETLTLKDLRKNISIIPQDPILFTGTLRSNLDPFEERNDEDIWQVLKQIELSEVVSHLSGGLNCKIADGGSNFSLGQRQLICLGRALLRKNKILVLDEATANVDFKTDALIQTTIREQFKNCTTLTIAHRLHTVIDSDRILVMDGGKMVEFDHPYKLLKNETGFLRKLVNETSSLVLDDLAKKNYEKLEQ